ncbi:MAG: protein kinase [Pyrinomonadaceae bacterium]
MTELKLQQCRLDNRYDVRECLGRGSYAEIYVAHDRAAGKDAPSTVVIKALNVFLQGTPDAELERTLVENFQNEAVALDRVRHPHIISRLGHGTAIDLAGTTFHYIVLEYLSGGDLAARGRQQTFSLDRALFYLEQVCQGLAHAHACGVIHRDIKPHNLLLTDDCQTVKIADFGVAKIEGGDSAITRVGTNIYAAPEHNPLFQTGQLDMALLADGEQRHLTPAADVYSLAKTAYTLIAGESPRRFSQRTITDFPASVSDKSWARAVLKVLRRATQTMPEERYQTVPEFWNELADAVLPPTQLLRPLDKEETLYRTGSLPLPNENGAMPEAPPRPLFDTPRKLQQEQSQASHGKEHATRPRIVVPVSGAPPVLPEVSRQQRKILQTEQQSARKALAAKSSAIPVAQRNEVSSNNQAPAKRGARLLVALILVTALAGMLYATHRYVRARFWGATTATTPTAAQPSNTTDSANVGREAVTTTDVNLRPDPSTNNDPIGLAEANSRVRVLSVKNGFYEVQILQHGRAKDIPDSKDRGWMKINKRFLELQ